jgi:hypothetical protein
MNKFIAQIFKSAGVDAKVSKDERNPRFRVRDGKLTLEGFVGRNKYSMTISDNTGKTIDSLSVSIDNSNDVVNRVNESISTLKLLSKAYDSKKLVEEDEEFDTISADDEIEVEDETDPGDIVDGLGELYDKIVDVAEFADNLLDLVEPDDAELKSTVIGFSSKLYDCAIDADDLISDLTEDEMEESVSRGVRAKKSDVEKVIDALTISESLLRKDKRFSSITTAIKDIKAELVLRGR